MATNRDVLELLDGLKVSLNAHLEAYDQALLRSWARAWTEVAAEWEAALDDLVAASTDGGWPSRTQIFRAERAKRALAVTRENLVDLARQMQVSVSQDLPRLVAEAVDWELRMMSAQLPPAEIRTAVIWQGFNRVDPAQVRAIVERTMTRVTAASRPIPTWVDTHIRSTLVRGVLVGENPRRAAARMRARIGNDFDLGRTRSLVIARTEMLDAHRAGAREFDKANRSVTAKWQWVSTLDSRACIGCIVMHGREFPVTATGPNGHQQCRCTRVPVLKSWEDLGFEGIEEPPPLFSDSKAWFDALPDTDQIAIAGRARWDSYRNGFVEWGDLVSLKTNRGWRDSWIPTPAGLIAP